MALTHINAIPGTGAVSPVHSCMVRWASLILPGTGLAGEGVLVVWCAFKNFEPFKRSTPLNLIAGCCEIWKKRSTKWQCK